jgi:YfiH family protein
VDGLITKKRGLFLGVRTADCLPILFFEPNVGIIGAVHAGWRGTLKNIAGRTVEAISREGGDIDYLLVYIGPHIKVCCYDPPLGRLQLFQKKFGEKRPIFKKVKKKIYLDLTYANFYQLLKSGVKWENIEVSDFCTSCRTDLFFSFRKDKKKDYGEMLTIIGLKNDKKI